MVGAQSSCADMPKQSYSPQPVSARGESSGLTELRDDFAGDTYRVIYSTEFEPVILVFHVFKKKSNRGGVMQRRDRALIRERWHRVRRQRVAVSPPQRG